MIADDQNTQLLADYFALELRSHLTERQLIAIDYANTYGGGDPDICATHDFIDANMVMQAALARTLGTSENSNLVNSDGAAGETARKLWNDAWSRKKKEGFSHLWSYTHLSHDEKKVLARYLAELPRAHDARYPNEVPVDNVEEYNELASEIADYLVLYESRLPDLAKDLATSERSNDEDAALHVLRSLKDQVVHTLPM